MSDHDAVVRLERLYACTPNRSLRKLMPRVEASRFPSVRPL